MFEFLDDNELLGGIVGSKADHHTAPYSLTEEFVAVYRMHPLIPDEFAFHSLATGACSKSGSFHESPAAGRRRLPSGIDDARPLLLVRHVAPGRHHAAQLSRGTCRT